MVKMHLLQYKKIFVWGTGYYLGLYAEVIPKEICGYIDNDPDKQGTVIGNKPIISPEAFIENNPDEKDTLIIVCIGRFEPVFEQICELGNYAAVFVEDYAFVLDAYNSIEEVSHVDILDEGSPNTILSVAGTQALLMVNGCKRFIDAQVRILNDNGYRSVEIAPIRFISDGIREVDLLAIRFNGVFLGTVSLKDLIGSISVFSGIILHSLYYDHSFMNYLVERIDSEKPVLYYAHDYYCVCTNRFLYNGDVTCIGPDFQLKCCDCDCYEKQVELRASHRDLFCKKNVKVIVPSQDMMERLKTVYRFMDFFVVPHLKYSILHNPNPCQNVLRVAFLGAMSSIKGWELFERLCIDCKNSYDFYYYGNTNRSLPENVIYKKTSLDLGCGMAEGLKKNDIDIACVMSVWPETYGYTLFEALEAGCYIVTTNKSGNVCRTVKELGCGSVFEDYEEMLKWFNDKDRMVEDIINHRTSISRVVDNDEFLKLLR